MVLLMQEIYHRASKHAVIELKAQPRLLQVQVMLCRCRQDAVGTGKVLRCKKAITGAWNLKKVHQISSRKQRGDAKRKGTLLQVQIRCCMCG